MTAEEFTVQIMDMKKTLYHVSCGILRSEADREDAVQECICKAWEKRNSLKSEGAFRAWVTRILINECYDICRRGSKIVLLDEMPEAVAPESGDRELRDAVMGLDEIYRMPILLFYVEGFSIREIFYRSPRVRSNPGCLPGAESSAKFWVRRCRYEGFLGQYV